MGLRVLLKEACLDKNENIKVSVCVTTYNQGEFVTKALESVLSQETSFAFDIVVVDDKSDDNTVRKIKGLQGNNPDVIKVSANDRNIGYVRNLELACRKCEGEYIAIFDGDDIMLPGKLQKQSDYLDMYSDCTIVGHDVRGFDSVSGKTKKIIRPRKRKATYSIDDLIKYGSFFANSSKMFRRNALPDSIIDDRIKHIADWPLTMEIALGGSIGYLHESLVDYRIHDASIMRKIKGQEHFNDIKIIIEDFNRRFPGRYENAFKRMWAYAYMIRGRSELLEGDVVSARRSVIMSIKCDPFYYGRQYLYLVLSCIMPSYLLRKCQEGRCK